MKKAVCISIIIVFALATFLSCGPVGPVTALAALGITKKKKGDGGTTQINAPPTVVITSGPSGVTSLGTPTFAWSGTDTDGTIAGYWIAIDVNPPDKFTTATSWTFALLSPGPHTFYVQSEDNDGAKSGVKSRGFDFVPLNAQPTVTIESGPSGTISYDTPAFSYSGNDSDGTVVGYWVSIDVNPPDIYTTNTIWTSPPLTTGAHTFYVQAEDDKGAKSTVESRSFAYEPMDWTPKSPVNKPSARYNAAMVYDPNNNVVVLFGGQTAPYTPVGETWLWDGTDWSQQNPANSPSPRYCHAMVYDTNRNVAVLFGGYDGALRNDTWVWDGTDWSQQNPADSPSPRTGHAMAYDSNRRKVVLFGGDDASGRFDDTWEFNETDWIQLFPANKPPLRCAHSMVYDSSHNVTVLFGGWTSGPCYNDTWLWDGIDWVEKIPANRPSNRDCTPMVFVSTQNISMLFGGWDGSTSHDDTWVWDGTDWSQQNPANSPLKRYAHTMAYDFNRNVVVMFGGRDQSSYFDDTWEFAPAP